MLSTHGSLAHRPKGRSGPDRDPELTTSRLRGPAARASAAAGPTCFFQPHLCNTIYSTVFRCVFPVGESYQELRPNETLSFKCSSSWLNGFLWTPSAFWGHRFWERGGAGKVSTVLVYYSHRTIHYPPNGLSSFLPRPQHLLLWIEVIVSAELAAPGAHEGAPSASEWLTCLQRGGGRQLWSWMPPSPGAPGTAPGRPSSAC